MSRSGTLEYTARGMSQDAGDALQGDIVRGLVEAITNSDDAYIRGELDGPISIVVEHLDDASLSARITVSDAATGMHSTEMLDKLTRLGARSSEFEQGTAVRGLHGRGARDLTIFGLLEFSTIKDDMYSCLTIEQNRWELNAEDEPASEQHRRNLSLKPTESGTTVRLHVRRPLTIEADVAERLSMHAELRHILDERSVTFTETGMKVMPARALLYERPARSVELLNQTIEIPGFARSTAVFRVWELQEPESGPVSAETHHGILVRGDRAVYDNTLFDISRRSGGGFLTGEFICPLIEELVRDFDDRDEKSKQQSTQNPIRLLTRTRDGLVARHPLTKAIRQLFSATLLPIVQELEARHTGERRPSEEVRRRLQRAGRELGRILADDLAEIDEPIEGTGQDHAPLRLVPSQISIRPNERKTLTVHARPSLISPEWDGEIEAAVSLSGSVELIGEPDEPQPHPDNSDLLVSRIRVSAQATEGLAVVTVRALDQTASCTVRIDASAPPLPEPPEGLEFSHQSYSLRPRRKRSIELLAPLDFLAGVDPEVPITYSGNSDIDLLTSVCRLVLDERLGWYRGRVSLLGEAPGSTGTVVAATNSAEASADLAVVEPSDPKGLDFEIEWQDRKFGVQRAALTPETSGIKLQIFGRHPAIETWLGAWDEDEARYEFDNSQEVGLVLAEIIATEMAHYVLEREFGRAGRDFDAATYAANYRRRIDRYLRIAQGMLAPD